MHRFVPAKKEKEGTFAMSNLNARDAKLVQYLNEAYGNEKRLETALQAHIGLTTRQPYKKRLQQHLNETKNHGRMVERRIKALGGVAETVSVPGPDVRARVRGAARPAAGPAPGLAEAAFRARAGPRPEGRPLRGCQNPGAQVALAGGSSTISRCLSICVTWNTRSTSSGPRTITRRIPRSRARASAAITVRRPVESMKVSSRRSSTSVEGSSRSCRLSSSSSRSAVARSSSPLTTRRATPLFSSTLSSRGFTSVRDDRLSRRHSWLDGVPPRRSVG